MKKLILSLALTTLLISCKEETKDKVQDASEAIASDVKEVVDSAAIKAEAKLDTVKAKTKTVIEKGAEKVEEGAKKVKEAAKK